MSLTRKHYQELARIIRCAREQIDGPDDKAIYIQKELASFLKVDNPRFDKERFNEACEP